MTEDDTMAYTLRDVLCRDDTNITDALLAISYHLKMLGNADASTPMGAIEALGAVHLECADKLSTALLDIAEAIRSTK